MGRDRQPGLAANPPLTQINVLLRAAVDDIDVDALAGAGPYVRGHDDEGVGVGGVPDAFAGDVGARGGEGEFDGVGGEWGGEEGEEEGGEEEEGEGWAV